MTTRFTWAQIGIEGTEAPQELAEAADVVIAIGTRMQDLTTGSWTTFAKDAKFININAARFDAHKHLALPVVGDALESLNDLDAQLGDWKAPETQMQTAQKLYADWNTALDEG